MTIRFQSVFLALLILAGLLVFQTPGNGAAEQTGGGVQWISYDQGMARAKQEQKKVFLYFYTDWCRYCKMMSDNTFVDKKVVAMLNRDFVPIQVNSDKFREVAAKYKVRPVPVSFFLEAGGQEIGSRPGYLQPDAFLRLLEFVKAEGYKP